MKVRNITRAAIIAALYVALTLLLSPFSFGAVQVRLSEAMTVLPILFPEATAGLTVGCLLSNLLGGAAWFDVVFGTLTTLAAACLTRYARRKGWLAFLPPVVLNGVIVGTIVYIAYVKAPGEAFQMGTCLVTALSVLAGEAISVFGAGTLLLKAVQKITGKRTHGEE